jgi:histidine triad (HIT) family protein
MAVNNSEETIFDKILAGDIPADVVFENEDVLAFRDVNPQAPVHVLVIPKQKITGFPDLLRTEQDAVGKFFRNVAEVAKKLDLEADGYRIVLNSGKNGQQTVFYLHAHILGGRQMSWPPG